MGKSTKPKLFSGNVGIEWKDIFEAEGSTAEGIIEARSSGLRGEMCSRVRDSSIAVREALVDSLQHV